MPGTEHTRTLSVRLLGPFVVTVDGAPLPLSSRLRTLLAVLALDVGRAVSTERIAAAVWGTDRPADTRKAIQVLVTRLRTATGAAAVRTTPGGYALDVPPEAVDLHRFETELARSNEARERTEEYRLLREALRHWRGLPFEAVDSDLLIADDRPRLLEAAFRAVERAADVALAAPAPATSNTATNAPDLDELAAGLRELVGLHPLRESLWVRLMAVLDRIDRRADALAAYQDLYRTLRDELGTRPGAEAQAVHRGLLADAPAQPSPPRMLPPPDAAFRGRAEALAALDALLDDAPGIAVVDGPGGIGKTTTVLEWAHRAADRFPDGTLYVNLRGYFPTNTPLAPEVAVRTFLDALGIPASRIPDDAEAQTALYRSVLADRRMLVVLDNARDVEQVRPLLPGGRRCVVVVTSRNRLGGLVAVEGAARLALGTLTPSEAADVLAARLGAARLAAEPAAGDALLALCGGLPLAHVIVAERAAGRPGAPLAAVVRELHGHDSRIAALSADGDRPARSVFSWSYRALGDDAARVFRLLGLHPGPHLTVPGVASLGAVTEQRARAAIAELERASLLTELAPGRFTMHELLMDYANELVAGDPPDDTGAATVRMLEHYLRAAHQAEEALAPTEDRHRLGAAPDGVVGTTAPTGHDAGLALFDDEGPVFVGMVRRAAATGNPEHTWRIARCLRAYLWARGQIPTLLETGHLALDALETLGDLPEQVACRRWITHALLRLGLLDDAWRTIEPILPLAENCADGARAWVLNTMAAVLAELGRTDEALDRATQALDLFRRSGDRVGEGRTESAVGLYLRRLGKLDDALAAAQRAFDTLTAADDLWIRAYTRELVGDIQRDRGEPGASADALRAYTEDLRALGRASGLAEALDKLAAAYEAAGEPHRAATARRDAEAVRAGVPAATSSRPPSSTA
jgi:DNA-binding SARP family transcriptional activator